MFQRIRKEIGKVYLFFVELVYDLFSKHLDRLAAEKIIYSIKDTIRIRSARSTLDVILHSIETEKAGLYLRFGDGDVFLMMNQSDMFQKNNLTLSREMEDAFSITGEGVIKCLAIHSEQFGYDPGMYFGNHKVPDDYAITLLTRTFKYFISQRIYSPVALHFIASEAPNVANNFLKKLKDKTKIFVGNENICKEIRDLLFGTSVYIRTPEVNAYNDIDRIESEVNEVLDEDDNFKVICVAMGCSGRILMSRIWTKYKNIFIFDFGSLLDGISGNNSRTWLDVNDIDYKTLLQDL